MPGINKENIKINAYDSALKDTAQEGVAKKYHENNRIA
jgi:HSP20 family molecular chaperone IbpA